MTEAQRLRLLELAVQAGCSPHDAIGYARDYERYIKANESEVVPSRHSTQDSGLSTI